MSPLSWDFTLLIALTSSLPTFSLSRSRDLSAPSIHFEYTRKSMFAFV